MISVRERAGGPQRVECCDGPRFVDAVVELEELRAELDIGQRASAELEVVLRIFVRGDALVLDASFDRGGSRAGRSL